MKVDLLKHLVFLVCTLLVLTETVIAKTIDVKPMHTINAPQKYEPGAEDKAGDYPDKNFKVRGVGVSKDVELPLAQSPMVIETESLLASAVVSAGNISRQEMGGFGSGWSDGKQLFWRPPAPVNTPIRNWPNLRLFPQASKAGRYRVTLVYTAAPDYGRVSVFVRGQRVKDFDGYASSVLPRRMVLGEFNLGTNRFEMLFTVFSKNSASSNYFVGLDYIELQPID